MCMRMHTYTYICIFFKLIVYNYNNSSFDPKPGSAKSTGLWITALKLTLPKNRNAFFFFGYLTAKLERWWQLPFSIQHRYFSVGKESTFEN